MTETTATRLAAAIVDARDKVLWSVCLRKNDPEVDVLVTRLERHDH